MLGCAIGAAGVPTLKLRNAGAAFAAEGPVAAVAWDARAAAWVKLADANSSALPDDHELVARARRLRAGQWLEIGDGDDAQRAKLAANIRDGAKLVFINRRGIKVREYDAAGLAQALHDGEVKLIEDGALFDRALEAVISDLRRMQSA